MPGLHTRAIGAAQKHCGRDDTSYRSRGAVESNVRSVSRGEGHMAGMGPRRKEGQRWGFEKGGFGETEGEMGKGNEGAGGG